MKTIETHIIIKANVTQVWLQLLDFKSYSDWNPFIREISGNAAIGEQLNVQIHPPEGNAMTFTPQVLTHTPNQEFRWIGKLFLKGIFDGEHYFKLRKISATETCLTHGENFSGFLVPFLFSTIEKNTTTGFQAMNEALKKQVETNNHEK